MIKKTLITSVLVMLILAFSVPASATPSSVFYLDDLIYELTGKITAKIDIKDYITLSVTIPKVEKYGERFFFFGNGTFMDELLFTATAMVTTQRGYPIQPGLKTERILPLIYRVWRTLLNHRLVRM